MKTIPALENALDYYKQEALETLQKWVRQPSVNGKAVPKKNAPFGEDVRKMLDIALKDCERLGLTVRDVDGYACQADMGEGSEKEALAILSHLDVVPVGDGWTKPPFGAVLEDDKVFGRGAIDDKGPAVAALYAMAAIKRAGLPLKRRVRLILGCDEETGMNDMRYYAAHAVMPASGFSPDADYPLINIEKGGAHVVLRGKMSEEGLKVLSFCVGERLNVIPGIAQAAVSGGKEEEKALQSAAEKLGFPIEIKTEGKTLLVSTIGKPGHAAMGENASNAIGQMLLILKHAGAKGTVKALAEFVGLTYYGENLGIAMEDRASGKLTCSLDMIKTDGNDIEAHLDIRFPLLMDAEKMLHVMNMTLNHALEAEMLSWHEPHFVSENSELVQKLLQVYTFVTGTRGSPIAIGGGTYARVMEEGVAFGAKFPEEPEMAHQADEYITLNSFYQSIRIFAYAIASLAVETEGSV